jgi:hypothetical protein
MTAALTSAQTALGETNDLVLLVLAERNGKVDTVVRVADVRAGVEEIDTTNADALVAVVINTTTSGVSRKPTICMGSPEEVADCKKAVEGAGGNGGEGAIYINPEKPPAWDCQMGSNASGSEWIPTVALAGLVQRRLRRRTAKTKPVKA